MEDGFCVPCPISLVFVLESLLPCCYYCGLVINLGTGKSVPLFSKLHWLFLTLYSSTQILESACQRTYWDIGWNRTEFIDQFGENCNLYDTDNRI